MKKFSLAFLSMIVLVSTFFASISSAATVGQRLTAPEAGWNRFDDSNPAIKYEGNSWGYVDNDSKVYARTGHYTIVQGGTSNAIKFKFYGTKLRIIDLFYNNRVDNVTIEIDGAISTYNPNNSSNLYQVLVFEKLDLPLAVHEVKLTTTSTSNNFSLDAIDTDGHLTDYYAPNNLVAASGYSQVSLSWGAVAEADSYIVRYGTSPGQYSQSITVTEDSYSNYHVQGLMNGTTYYFMVTSVINGSESEGSNEASATPIAPSNPDRAFLTIYISDGQIKEYDLSAVELNAFLNWYDAKDAGSAPAKYAFTKTWNKGPFKTRTEYVIFDKILTFDVDEYEVENP